MKTIKHAIVWACVGSALTTGLFTMILNPEAASAGAPAVHGGSSCPCPGDFNADNLINTADLVTFLGVFGSTCSSSDSDGDGVPDASDNCPSTFNPNQLDSDNNGIGDACETTTICTPGSVRNCYSGPAGTDGIGQCRSGIETCNAQGTACSPCEGEVLPGIEICNGIDDNCNGLNDDNPVNGIAYFRDNDNDTFGQCADFIFACQPQGNYRTTNCGDCNDNNANIRPGAPDPLGDGIDQDCDGVDG